MRNGFNFVLGLTGALKKYFQLQSVHPAQAVLIYMDVSAYDNDYSIQGRYRREGDQVKLIGRLYKGDDLIGGEFQVLGRKDDLPALAEKIVDTIWPMLGQ